MCTQVFACTTKNVTESRDNAVHTWACRRKGFGVKCGAELFEKWRSCTFRSILWLQRGGRQGSGRKEIIKAKRNSFAANVISTALCVCFTKAGVKYFKGLTGSHLAAFIIKSEVYLSRPRRYPTASGSACFRRCFAFDNLWVH